MKVMVVYRPRSEQARQVEDFLSELDRISRGRGKVEIVDVDTREGSATASLYDIMRYPQVMVVGDDGRVIYMWESGSMPLLTEVIYYMNQSVSSLQMV